MKETRIVDVIREYDSTTYVTEQGTYIKKTRGAFSVYDSNPRYGGHKTVHFHECSDGSLIVKESGKEEVKIPAWMFR